MAASADRSSSRPINWAVTAVVFFAGSVLLWADRTNFSVAAAAWAKEFGVMNFFGIVGATLSPYGTGLIAQATGAFVAPLVLAVVIMLVGATTTILLFRYRPLSELVAQPLPAAKVAAKT